jgi:hypothetical protein
MASYKFPEHLEKYRPLISNTGGNSVENLLDRLKNEEGLAFSNIVVFTMAISVECQISLLARLYKEGLLK